LDREVEMTGPYAWLMPAPEEGRRRKHLRA